MSEWLREHAWKTNQARRTDCYRNISRHNRLDDLPLQDAPRCEPLSVDVHQWIRAGLTDFLHNSASALHPVLTRIDPRKAQIVEMRFFGGLTVEEFGEVLKVSTGTIQREWRTARVWLYHELSHEQDDGR